MLHLIQFHSSSSKLLRFPSHLNLDSLRDVFYSWYILKTLPAKIQEMNFIIMYLPNDSKMVYHSSLCTTDWMVHIVCSFEPFPLKVALDRQATDLPWPPGPPPTEPRKIRQGSSVDLRVACGDSHSTFSFSVFKYPANQTEGSKAKNKQVTRAPFTLSNPLIWINCAFIH